MTQVWSAGIKRLHSGGQISWTSAIENGVHNAAQFDLHAPWYWKPVQLKEAGCDVINCAQLEHRAVVPVPK